MVARFQTLFSIMNFTWTDSSRETVQPGNGKAAVFHNEVDRRSFGQTLAEACAKTDWQVHAYCLIKTHFHLVVETPRANLVPGMKWLLSTYTIRFNRPTEGPGESAPGDALEA